MAAEAPACQDRLHVLVEVQMARIAKMAKTRNIQIVHEPSACDWLASKTLEPALGAHLLKQMMQRWVQNPFAALMLSGGIKAGEQVVIAADEQGLRFNGRPLPAG